MSGILTLSTLTRSFIHLLDGCLREHVSWQFSTERPEFTQEVNADVVILPEHLRTKSLDDVAQELIFPAAGKMAEDLKETKSIVIYNAPAPDGVAEFAIHRFEDISVRGMVMRGVEIDGLIVDAFRFTVFYREGTLQ